MNAGFLFSFLLSTLIAFTLASRMVPRLAAPILLLASFLFYAVENPSGLPLLLASILFNFLVAGRIAASSMHARRWMILGVVLNLLPLVFYKYLHHPSTNEPAGLMVVFGAIPLGLSFYTFQQISCLIDIQRSVLKNKPAVRLGLLDHALFASFFAQIPAGPISLYRNLAPQITSVGQTPVSARDFSAGLSLFALGLGKKVLIAGTLATPVDHFYAQLAVGSHLTFLQAWFTAWTFLLQLYFDFSGYSDMALGVALCFGLSLPPNFNSPLKGISGTEFVDRWHMSLVGWIREYLYQPVLHLVVKLPFGSAARRRVIGWAAATIVSMAVIGAWHGSQFIFMLLGTIAGVLLVVRQLASTGPWSRRNTQPGVARKLFSHLLHLAALCVLVTPMRARTTAAGFTVIRTLFDVHSLTLNTRLGVDNSQKLVLLAATLIVFLLPNTMQIFGILPGPESKAGVSSHVHLAWQPTAAWGLAIGCVLVLALFFSGVSQQSGFIYAQF